MKPSTIIAAVVFVALGAGAFYSLTRKPEKGITRLSFASVDKDKLDKVSIKGPNPIEMTKQGEVWLLGDGKPADADAVKRMLEALPTIVSSDLVTKDSARFAELEVNDEKGTHVQAFQGANLVADFVVGKTAAGGANVRAGDAVYTVAKVYPYLFSKAASAWHQLKLFDDKLEDVSRVEVGLQGAAPYALVKANDNWSIENVEAIAQKGFRFDANAARTLVSTLVNARAQKLLDTDPGADKTGFEKGDTLSFIAKDGAKRVLVLGGATDDKAVYAQVGGKADVYTLADYSAKGLRKAALELRDLSCMTIDKEKGKRLTIKTAKSELVFEKKGADWAILKSSEAVPADFKLDPAAVDRRLMALGSVRGTGLAPAGTTLASAGLAKPSATVTLTLDDGKSQELAFGGTTKDGDRDAYFVKGNADGDLYLVAKWTYDNLTGGLSSFKQAPPAADMPNIDPSQLGNLPPDVRASLMQQLQQKKQEQEMLKRIQAQAGNAPAPDKAPAPAK